MTSVNSDLRTADPASLDTAEPARRVDDRAWLRDRIDGSIALAVVVAWFVLSQVAVLLEPEAHHPVPLIGVVLTAAMYALLLAMVAGLAVRRRWGLAVSVAAAVVATAASIACPVSGHHGIGVWWFGQMACVIALLTISVAALRTPASSES